MKTVIIPAMAVEEGTFEELHPSRLLSFTFPNPSDENPYASYLRVAVLDSPSQNPNLRVVGMMVPIDREDDWIFSTESGHHQLLSSSGVSRLILVGNLPAGKRRGFRLMEVSGYEALETSLIPLLLALSPRILFNDGEVPSVAFLRYEDDVLSLSVVAESVGPIIGQMLIEDAEVICQNEPEKRDGVGEIRRRLRFKRMPNLIQTEIPLVKVSRSRFLPDLRRLVHPYLPPMVASLALIASFLQECVALGSRPRVLCVGVGGGALLGFLRRHFKFDVIGVEMDEVVLMNARRHFGLSEDEFLRVYVGDGIEWLIDFARRAIQLGRVSNELLGTWEKFGLPEMEFSENNSAENPEDGDLACRERVGICPSGVGVGGSFVHVILVDVDSGDAKSGLSAPPIEFVSKRFVLACRIALHDRGILAINVIPPSKSFYHRMVTIFKEFFLELYEIEVDNGENYVLIAAASRVDSTDEQSPILKKLRQIIEKTLIDKIRKI